MVEKLDLYGLNVAHSGNVAGIMFDSRLHDLDRLFWQLNKINVSRYYPGQYKVETVAGGMR